MTVGELIDALKDVDPSLEVIAEGCDCENPATEVRVRTYVLRDGTVYAPPDVLIAISGDYPL